MPVAHLPVETKTLSGTLVVSPVDSMSTGGLHAGRVYSLEEGPSDQTIRSGRLDGGGTDTFPRHYPIESSARARQIPRNRKTYERVEAKRGKKIGRIVVARLILRSIYTMIRDGVAFNQTPAA